MSASPVSLASAPGVLFGASRRLVTLEHFGTPYRVGQSQAGPGLEQLSVDGDAAALLWPSAPGDGGTLTAASLRGPGGGEIPIFARLVPDDRAEAMLSPRRVNWTRAYAIFDGSGDQAASIWRGDDGSVFLPFDPDEVRLNYISEGYRDVGRRPGGHDWRRIAMLGYYRARDLMPRPVQIWLRRHYARIQAKTPFPRWPVETGLHDFLELFFGLIASMASEPVPRIAAWPNGSSWALVLTHDVETTVGVEALPAVVELERSLGLRSSWNFVPRRYSVSDEQVRALQRDGFEVGVHGLYHDGRDLESAAMLRDRLPGMQGAAARWDAVGFRSPATHRDWELMPLLGFDYDSSYPDTDPFEPQGGGCCTWLPFFNGELLELPLTMPQDHTLFVILRRPDEQAWLRKAEFLRSRGGMALLDTHPDYLTEQLIFDSYRRFLERFADDASAWKALPGEVSAWWRRRAASQLERVGGDWTVTGPAAEEARVEFVTASDWI
jgi:hypothetical protein